MKFNFESFGNKAKDKIKKATKIGLIAGAGLITSNSAEAQTQAQIDARNTSVEYLNKVAVDFPEKQKDTYQIKKDDKVNVQYAEGLQPKLDNFFLKLQKLGLIPDGMDEYTFANLSEAEHKDYVAKYMKKTGAITRDQLPADNYTVIEIRQNEVNKKFQNESQKPIVEDFNFNTWFKEQIQAGKQGQIVEAPNGQKYLIKVDENAKSSFVAKSTTEKKSLENNNLASVEKVERVNMADLHDEDKDSRLDK